MARIAGINIPPHQHADIGLTSIYGIGRARARAILDAAGVPYDKKVKELNDAEVERIREAMGRATVEGDLRREVQLSIKRLIDLGTYRGVRHASAEVSAKIARGEHVDRHEYYLRITPFFETGAERYLWLNHIVSVGVGERTPHGADYEVFQVL